MLHTTHHDKVDKGNSVGMDIKHPHGAQHVCNDTSDSEQDDGGCPNIETQEENAHQKYSTCRRGFVNGGMGELEGGGGGVREGGEGGLKRERREGGRGDY